MRSEIKTYTYPNGDIQQVQLVRWEDWSKLDFLEMTYSDGALECFANIYRNFLVPAAPLLFGHLVMFRIPADMETHFPPETEAYGTVADRLTAAAAALKEGLKIVGGKPVFKNKEVEAFWQELVRRNSVHIISGKLPETTIIPVGGLPGYLTRMEENAAMKVNASFFIMDRFDCATVYDHVGTPFGLCVKDGFVARPPLYNREALLVKNDGTVSVRNMDVTELEMEINGQVYTPGKNCTVYTRPQRMHTPADTNRALVVIGTRVAAVCSGRIPIPTSGFVLCPREAAPVRPGDAVTYRGLEDVRFGIQVGNSILRDGVKTQRFLSQFYNIKHMEPVPYPPSLYPMDFRNARAARIALGADRDGRPMLLWAEGAAKFGYQPGKGSCGASLSEMAEICADVGMVNAVNLDGGGSAQILLNNCRTLKISDRNAEDFGEAERPIPLALTVK